jgi:cell division septal protein FtsQ
LVAKVPEPPIASGVPSALPTKRLRFARSIANSPEDKLTGVLEPRLMRRIGFAIVFYFVVVVFVVVVVLFFWLFRKF